MARADGTAGDWSGPGHERVHAARQRRRRRLHVLEGINPASTSCGEPDGGCDDHAGRSWIVGCPPSGGLIWGQAALIDLDGATIETMQIKSPAAMSPLERGSEGCERRLGAPRLPSACAGSQRRAASMPLGGRLPASPDPGPQCQRCGSRSAPTGAARRAAPHRGGESPQRYQTRCGSRRSTSCG